jgi:septum formation protein
MKKPLRIKKNYILASKSPRRQDLLHLIGLEFDVIPSHVDEIIKEGLTFEEVVQDIAVQKAIHIAKEHPDATVLGFDTLVIFEGEALGKPTSREEAFDMLKRLQGNTHTVLTGCALVCCDETETLYGEAEVTFYPMNDDEINEYLDTEEPFDKAGSYGIQGYGARYIKNVNGDYYSVMGVPVAKLYQLLRGSK